MNRESYLNGFIKTANAYGIDPRVLARYASERLGEESEKKASYKPKTLAELSRLISERLGK